MDQRPNPYARRYDRPPAPANSTPAEEYARVVAQVNGYIGDHATAHREQAAARVLRAALLAVRGIKGDKATADFCLAFAAELTTIN